MIVEKIYKDVVRMETEGNLVRLYGSAGYIAIICMGAGDTLETI